jgi:hypothetical protein
VPRSPEEGRDPLATAYDERNAQLYEARAGLAEAVAALTVELRELRERAQQQAEAIAALEALVELQRNMKVVRWTRWPRQFVDGLRDRRR